jgi:hypothetical protein
MHTRSTKSQTGIVLPGGANPTLKGTGVKVKTQLLPHSSGLPHSRTTYTLNNTPLLRKDNHHNVAQNTLIDVIPPSGGKRPLFKLIDALRHRIVGQVNQQHTSLMQKLHIPLADEFYQLQQDVVTRNPRFTEVHDRLLYKLQDTPLPPTETEQ